MWGIGSHARLRHCSRIQLAGTRHRSDRSSAVKTSKNGSLRPHLMCSRCAPGGFIAFLSRSYSVRRFYFLTGESRNETPAPWVFAGMSFTLDPGTGRSSETLFENCSVMLRTALYQWAFPLPALTDVLAD